MSILIYQTMDKTHTCNIMNSKTKLSKMYILYSNDTGTAVGGRSVVVSKQAMSACRCSSWRGFTLLHTNSRSKDSPALALHHLVDDTGEGPLLGRRQPEGTSPVGREAKGRGNGATAVGRVDGRGDGALEDLGEAVGVKLLGHSGLLHLTHLELLMTDSKFSSEVIIYQPDVKCRTHYINNKKMLYMFESKSKKIRFQNKLKGKNIRV